MNSIDLMGWLAAVFTLAAFSMNTMLPLRILAIFSNVCFIAYGYFGAFYPALALHLVLLPFNCWRLWQISRLLGSIRTASAGELDPEWILSVTKPVRYRAGDVVFKRGDRADRLYFLNKGVVRIVEIARDLHPGQIFGEIAFFLDNGERTQTIQCKTDCEILSMDEQSLLKLYYQNPKFGFYVIRLIANRMSQNSQAARLGSDDAA